MQSCDLSATMGSKLCLSHIQCGRNMSVHDLYRHDLARPMQSPLVISRVEPTNTLLQFNEPQAHAHCLFSFAAACDNCSLAKALHARSDS